MQTVHWKKILKKKKTYIHIRCGYVPKPEDDVKDHVGEYEIIKNEHGFDVYHCLNVTTYTFCDAPVNGEEKLETLFNEIDDKINSVMKVETLSDAIKPILIDAKDQIITDKNHKSDSQKVVKNTYYDNYNYHNSNKSEEENILIGTIKTEDKSNNINTINIGNNINNGKKYNGSKNHDSGIITWVLISGLLAVMVIALFFWRRNRRNYSKSNSTKKSNNTEKENPSIPKNLISKNKFNFKTIQMDTLSIDEDNNDTPNIAKS